MICILKIKRDATDQLPDAIAGWLIASDVHDARRQAQGIGEMDLANTLYRHEWLGPGKHRLTQDYVALVT